MRPLVTAVSRSNGHTFSKPNVLTIRLVAGLGVEGDAHYGDKVQHVFHARRNPDAPNLRQVHLIHEELFDELRTSGFQVRPGDIGENVTTRGLDLLALPTGTLLQVGNEAVLRKVLAAKYPAAASLKESDIADASFVDELEHNGFIDRLYAGGSR